MPDDFTPESLEPQRPGARMYQFEWKKFGAMKRLAAEYAMPPGVAGIELEKGDDLLSFCSDQLLLRLKAYVLTHDLGEHSVTRSREIEWPATPWQMFKHQHAESWWLGWLARWLPVRMQTQTVDYCEAWQELAAYPWNTYVPPISELGRATRIVQIVGPDWDVR